MITNLSFNYAREALSELEGVDVGDCAIEAMDVNENLYYIIVKTIRGTSYILKYGPLGDSTNIEISISNIKFNEKKLKSILGKWLNDYTKEIFEAKLVEPEEALENFPNIVERFNNIGIKEND